MKIRNKLIRYKAVIDLTGLSKTTIYRLMNDGKFPQQIRMSEKTVAWVESEVQEWVDARVAERGEVS